MESVESLGGPENDQDETYARNATSAVPLYEITRPDVVDLLFLGIFWIVGHIITYGQ